MKRILSLFLALAALCSLAACGEKEPPEPPVPNVIRDLLEVEPEETLLTVDGNELSVGVYLYQFLYTCQRLSQYYGDYLLDEEGNFLWDQDMGDGTTVLDLLRDATEANALSYAVVENLSKTHGVELTEENQAELDESLQRYVEEAGGEEAYREELGRMGLTWDDNLRLARGYYYYLNLLDRCVTPDSDLYITDDVLYANEEITEDSVMADHILFRTGEDEEQNQQARSVMEEMKTMLDEAEDPVALFTALADSYSQDPGRTYYPDGYVFGRGVMVQPFEDAAFALGEYEISDIVESEHGYHLILRKPLRDYIKDSYLQDLLDQAKESAVIEWNQELLDKISLPDFYTGYLAWTEARNAEEDSNTDGNPDTTPEGGAENTPENGGTQSPETSGDNPQS